jgi:tRNA (guanosine-2'-O-)-methyltransferase
MDFTEIDQKIERFGAQRVIERVAPFVSEARRARIEPVLQARLDSVHVAVERPQDPRNAAAVVRTAEALGLCHVHVVDALEGALHATRTTQGAYHWLSTYHHADLASFRSELLSAGVKVFGAVMGGRLIPEQVPIEGPVCLLFGNETSGLSAAALSLCDDTFRIPMAGMSESLNLSVSAAIGLYSVTSRRRVHLQRAGDLQGPRYLLEKARFYAHSVERRLLDELLPREGG